MGEVVRGRRSAPRPHGRDQGAATRAHRGRAVPDRFRREAAHRGPALARGHRVGARHRRRRGPHVHRHGARRRAHARRARRSSATPLDLRRIAQIGAAAARALAHAHDRGVLHRDVSPANVMVTVDGTVKVLDFGIARGHDDQLGSAAASRGTVDYLAPEVLRGQPVDARADVYALGVVLRELARELDDRRAGSTPCSIAPRRRSLGRGSSRPRPSRRALDGLAGSIGRTVRRDGVRAGPANERTRPLRSCAWRPARSAPRPPTPALERAPQVAIARTRAVTANWRRLVRAAGASRDPRDRSHSAARRARRSRRARPGRWIGRLAGERPRSYLRSRCPRPTGLVASASCDGLFSTGVDLDVEGPGPREGLRDLAGRPHRRARARRARARRAHDRVPRRRSRGRRHLLLSGARLRRSPRERVVERGRGRRRRSSA